MKNSIEKYLFRALKKLKTSFKNRLKNPINLYLWNYGITPCERPFIQRRVYFKLLKI